jgi:IS5 family transposase
VFDFAGFRARWGEKLAIPRAGARGEFPPAGRRDSLPPDAAEDDAMRPKIPSGAPESEDLFRSRPANMLDPRHEPLRLAAPIDRAALDAAFGPLYAETGRPGLPTRLPAGLHLPKHAKGLSDEQVCAQWVENPYFQAFCGEAWFRHRLPLDRSSMTRWRHRIGPERLEAALAETVAAAKRVGATAETHARRATIGTTVQTEAVAHPTDGHLLHAGVRWLTRRHGVALRPSSVRLAAHARREAARLMHGPGHQQALRHVRRLRVFLGRLHRDVGRKLAGRPDLAAAFTTARERVARLLAQKPGDTGKLYALHAPEVECIGRGKARVRYEFGVKLGVAVSNARAPGGQFVLGVRTLPGNPYDGHTLAAQIARVERLTGERVERAYVDRGYRGHDADAARVFVARQRRGDVTPTIRRELRRRNAVEPVIGHLKSDGLVGRNRLAGNVGDATNAILAAAGHNLRLLLAWLRLLCAWIAAALRSRPRRIGLRIVAAALLAVPRPAAA